MSKCCVICGGDESGDELLIEAPCGRHWVCSDDVGSFFENATSSESLFPPKCCGQIFMLQDYEDYVPFETAWAYQVKEQGEYAILAKFRVYCANPSCAKFLHPTTHIEDTESKFTYAICEDDACGKLTCVKCKTLIDQGTQNHICQQDENEKKFKETATEKGYQECFVCGAIVELAEACNHITCECGHDFCYICGKDWPGLHGCPQYGPATYDEEGYNQDGFHCNTGLNRDGLTRRQDMLRHEAEEGEEEGDDDEGDEGDDNDPDWEVLQHLTPEQRDMINMLPNGPREDALDQFRIELFETQGITFNQDLPQPQLHGAQNEEEDDDADNDEIDHDDDSSDSDSDSDSDNEEEDEDGDLQDDHDDPTNEETLQGDQPINFPILTAERTSVHDGTPDTLNYMPELYAPLLAYPNIVPTNAPDTTVQDLKHGTALTTLEDTSAQSNSSSSATDSDDASPTTPMNLDEPMEDADKGDVAEHRDLVHRLLPGGWVEDELL